MNKIEFLRTLKQTCSQDYPRAPLAFKNLMIHEFCNSHYVSHFAAFFIVVGAKTSTVTGYVFVYKSFLFFWVWFNIKKRFEFVHENSKNNI